MPLRVLDRAGLRASVRRELERLLNTRCSLPAAEVHARARTVLEYGIPDFSHVQTRDPVARAAVAAAIERAVAAYEPRLRHPRVYVEDGRTERGLIVRVDGFLVVDDVPEAVSFKEMRMDRTGEGSEA